MTTNMETSINIAQKPMYIPCLLRTLLLTVKNINVKSTLEEVLDAMKDYIYKNTLYDLKDPCIVYCDESLSNVLNTPKFTLFELKKILLKLILKENTETVRDLRKSLQAPVFKRKSDDIIEEENKRFRLPNHNLASSVLSNLSFNTDKSSTDSDSSLEDTVLIKEMGSFSSGSFESDDFSGNTKETIVAVEKMYEFEYEIDSQCSTDNDVSITDTDSEIEDFVQAVVTTMSSGMDSDEDFWADNSSNEFCDFSETDEEMMETEKWQCSNCGIMNKPHVRYCLKCWNLWQDHHFRLDRSDRIPPHRKRKRKNTKRKNDKLNIDGNIQPGSSKSSSSSQSVKSDCSQNGTEKLCIICCTKQMDATVVHGKIGHQFSCYKCARQLQSLKKPCPFCRRSIDRVIHQIVLG